jgi:diguanylate cyclase (GGDEF)-like protein
MPLVAQGDAIGLLHLARGAGDPIDSLGEHQRQIAASLAEHAALALANLRLRDTLSQQSIRDPLTGLFNRRYLEETLERELRRAERKARPLAVVVVDVDRFKVYNDTFGHMAGDAALREIARLLQQGLRAGDVACRFGGEEFVLLMPEATAVDARRRANEFREAARPLHISHLGRSLGPGRLSLGVAAYPEHGNQAEVLLRAADAALYEAKNNGRDQVTVAAVPAS